jgi:CHASE2 domain-containing sensor protein
VAGNEIPSEPASPTPSRPTLPVIAFAIVLTIAALWAGERLALLGDLEGYLVDYRIRNGSMSARDPSLVYISVDKTTYAGDFPAELIGRATPDDQYFMTMLRDSWPWSRELWAHVGGRLLNAGAKGVLLDFVFPSEKPEDPELKAALDTYSPRLLVGALIDPSDDMISLIPPTSSLIEPGATGDSLSDPRVGLLNLRTDSDGVVRRAMYAVDLHAFVSATLGGNTPRSGETETRNLPSAAERAVRLINPSATFPSSTAHPLMRYTGPPGTFEPISLKRLIDPEEWRTQFAEKDFFRDKFVVIGPGSAILNDLHLTPFKTRGSKMTSSEVRLNQINAALQEGFYAESSQTTNRSVLLAAGMTMIGLLLGLRNRRARIIATLALSACFVAGVLWLADSQGYMLTPVVTPLAILNGGTILASLAFTGNARP